MSGTLRAVTEKGGAITLRPLQPGDLGWVISQHGALYAAEYGFDIGFEIEVAGIVAEVMRDFDPSCDGAWIAEAAGERLGAVFLVRHDDTTAKLRLLIVSPAARGMGLGRKLTETAVQFAKQAGYCRVSLWTMAMLAPARAIYAALGFKLVSATPNHAYGQDMVDEVWLLEWVDAAKR